MFGVYWSAWEKQAALNAAAQFVRPGVLKRWGEQSFVVDALVAVPEDRERWRQAAGEGPRRLLFAGRLNQNKRYQEVLEAYAKVLMSREDVEVWIHSGTGAFTKLDKLNARWHRTSESLPRDEYQRLLCSSRAGAYLSNDEGANITSQELIVSGVSMVFLDRPWVEKLFYPYKYPYVVKRLRDVPTMLDWLLDNYEESYRRLTTIREFIVRERSWPAFLTKMRRVVDAVRDEPRPKAYRVMRNVARDLAGEGDRNAVLMSQLRQMGPKLVQPQQIFSMSHYARYLAVRDLDDMRSVDPRLDLTQLG